MTSSGLPQNQAGSPIAAPATALQFIHRATHSLVPANCAEVVPTGTQPATDRRSTE